MKNLLLLLSALLLSTRLHAIEVRYTATPIVIDGQDEPAWQQATWQDMPHLLAGTLPTASDFSGKYRLLWDKHYLYIQARITDDILFDKSANPLEAYWDDDCLEVFIDSDASGGIHQYNHTAFAYHISLDNQAADLGPDRKPHLFTEHLISRWQRSSESSHDIIWEVAVKLFPNDYQHDSNNTALVLSAGQVIGFMLAYCDNDGSQSREHFMGSHRVTPVEGDTNRGWIDASVFGKITLTGQ